MAQKPIVDINKCRVAELADMIRKEGSTTGELIRYCQQEYGIAVRNSYALIARARAAIAEDFDNVERHQLMATQVHRYEMIFRKAVESECWPSAVGALNAINSMLGIGFNTK